MVFAQFTIRGLFVPMIDELKPDILCLQETKAQQHQSEVDLPEFEEYWNSAERKGYSGTAIFTKQKPISVRIGLPEHLVLKYSLSDDSFGNPNNEGRVLAVELNDYTVVTVYTPNSKPDLSRLKLRHTQWDPAFLEYCVELKKEKPVVFLR
jgi:exodeoxyribonuclease-3